MRIATLVCLSFAVSFGALPFALSAAECDSAVQIKERNSQLVIKNISGEPIVAYVLTSHSKSRDGSATRTYSGTFSGEDSLAAGAFFGTRRSTRGLERTIRQIRPVGQ